MPEQNAERKNAYVAMYDVRGIQGYIYRTNKLKEIIAASKIVENIFEESLKLAIKKLNISRFALEWEKQEYKESKTEEGYDVQVLFIGGGNAFVQYSSGELCHKVNRKLAGLILDRTYSMQLACASKEKSTDYFKDYKELSRQMGQVKGKMPMTHTFHALPIIQTDRETGYPVVEKRTEQYDSGSRTVLLSEESRLKRNGVRKYEDRHNNVKTEKIFDNMVTQKGKDSFLAVVHIDGNSMGKSIAKLMDPLNCKEGQNNYELAVSQMRKISYNIRHSFREVYNEMQDWACAHSVLKDGNIPIREIICAGDDITFVCNGSMALDCVEYFLENISRRAMYWDTYDPKDITSQDIERYGFSACAGIAYFKSHYPFSDAYQTAEACCSSAKKRAKSKQHTVETADGQSRRIGNWLDFQICLHISSSDLEQSRIKNYSIFDGTRLERRPYYVPFQLDMEGTDEDSCRKQLNERNSTFDFSQFRNIYRRFNDRNKIPSGLAKSFRDTYSYGKKEMERLADFAKSRLKELPGSPYICDPDRKDASEETIAAWYDALEMQELYADIYKREDGQDGKNQD